MKNATKLKNGKIKDYETIIGMFSKTLDELVHACEDEIDDYARINRACDEAKKLLPFYQPKEYED